MQVKILRINPHAILPTKATPGSAGWDLYVPLEGAVSERLSVYVGSGVSFGSAATRMIAIKINLGFCMEIEPGFEAQVRTRSGLAQKGVQVFNSPGTIDADYRGEVSVILVSAFGDHVIMPGDRIAQMVFAPVLNVSISEVSCLSETTRGSGGFGSSGR
jgi:dUTP pyrophosphatase